MKKTTAKIKSIFTGFTLLEILLVVCIIAILAGIVIVAINPGRQLALARNTQRKSDLSEINKALIQFYIDKGYYPTSTTLYPSLTEIRNGLASSLAECADDGFVDLSELVPVYLSAIPTDPQASTTCGSGYQIIKYQNNHIGLNAPLNEVGLSIALGIPPGEGGIDPCDGLPNVGAICLDGTVYAGSNYRTTQTDAGIMLQNNAAAYCSNLGNGWALPSLWELRTVFYNQSNCKSGNNLCNDTGYIIDNFLPYQYWASNVSTIKSFDDGYELAEDDFYRHSFYFRCLKTI
jgi:prepilin-type N-terminal cleavage/methylation domain-containing protein